MDVKANATRVINERGNQVLTVTGQVDSNSTQPVLPAGQDYLMKSLGVQVRGGSVYFSLEVEAATPTEKVNVPVLPTDLTRQEQEELFLKDLLERGDITDEQRFNILSKLGMAPEVKDAEKV
jgi:hypothetical protein